MAAIDFKLTTKDGKDVSAFAQILKARSQELGETTKNSCAAVAINILKSIRSQTKVAKVNEKMTIHVQCVDKMMYPSFKIVGGKHVSIFRAGKNGSEIKPTLKVIHIEGKYHKGMIRHTYRITDVISKDRQVKYFIVALSAKDAYRAAVKKRKKRIQERRGLAKLCLGVAMHRIHDDAISDNVTEQVKGYAEKNVEATVSETGFNSGNTSIHVHDKIDYATLALKDGEAALNTCVQKSMNKMMAYIIHRLHQKGIDTNLKIPYPELKKGGET